MFIRRNMSRPKKTVEQGSNDYSVDADKEYTCKYLWIYINIYYLFYAFSIDYSVDADKEYPC